MLEEKIYNKLIAFILCITPIIITPFYQDYFYFPKIYFVMIMSSIGGLIWFLNRDFNNAEFYYTEKIIVLYFTLVLISTYLSVDLYRSVFGIRRREEGILVILLYVFLFIFSRRKFIFSKVHIKLFVISSTIVALYGIAQYFGFDPIPRDPIRINWQGRAFSTMGNPNFFGAYLSLILPIASYIYIKTKKKRHILFPGVIYLALLTTMTRGSWLGGLISISFLSVYLFKDKNNLKYLGRLFLLFLIITLFIEYQSNGRVVLRFLSISNDLQNLIAQGSDYESGGAHRIFIWKHVLVLIKESPIFGYGIETLDIVFIKRFLGDILDYFGGLRRIDKAHNEYLHIAVSSGIPALLVYLYFIGNILKSAFKNINKNQMVLPLLASIIGYLVQSFFNISVVSVAYIFWIFLGILVKFSVDTKLVND